MNIHVLSGDSLVETFKKTNIEGEIIVCRECLVDGDLQAENLAEFWQIRGSYLTKTYGDKENFYKRKVKTEFEKLLKHTEGNEVHLWFEYELFCQVNLWFCLWLLRGVNTSVYIVYPYLKNKNDIWKGFGFLDENGLKQSFVNRIKLDEKDLSLGKELWIAFRDKDFEKLNKLGQIKSEAFPTIKEVCQAACEIETRPMESLQSIIQNGANTFGEAFQKFNEIEAIYGFGDLQVKKIYGELDN